MHPCQLAHQLQELTQANQLGAKEPSVEYETPNAQFSVELGDMTWPTWHTKTPDDLWGCSIFKIHLESRQDAFWVMMMYDVGEGMMMVFF